MRKLRGLLYADDIMVILAMRIPTNIPSRSSVASKKEAKFSATLLLVSVDRAMDTCHYRPEPDLASASALLMSKEGIKAKVFEELTEYLGRFGPEAGVGGGLITMLVGKAASDHLTDFRPHMAIKLNLWLSVFLGISV